MLLISIENVHYSSCFVHVILLIDTIYLCLLIFRILALKFMFQVLYSRTKYKKDAKSLLEELY